MEPANSTLQKKRLDPPGNIKISFTNADTLTNKMAELSIRLRQEKPLVESDKTTSIYNVSTRVLSKK